VNLSEIVTVNEFYLQNPTNKELERFEKELEDFDPEKYA